MTKKKITVADVRKFHPCYDPTNIKGITEKSEMSLLEILKHKEIKDVDKIRIATRFLSETENRKFAVWCARQCRTKVKEIKLYINAIENYYINKTITYEQLMAADIAADSAGGRAAYISAYSAADMDADSASEKAANSAANTATNSATMRKKQIKYLIKKAGETNG